MVFATLGNAVKVWGLCECCVLRSLDAHHWKVCRVTIPALVPDRVCELLKGRLVVYTQTVTGLTTLTVSRQTESRQRDFRNGIHSHAWAGATISIIALGPPCRVSCATIPQTAQGAHLCARAPPPPPPTPRNSPVKSTWVTPAVDGACHTFEALIQQRARAAAQLRTRTHGLFGNSRPNSSSAAAGEVPSPTVALDLHQLFAEVRRLSAGTRFVMRPLRLANEQARLASTFKPCALVCTAIARAMTASRRGTASQRASCTGAAQHGSRQRGAGRRAAGAGCRVR